MKLYTLALTSLMALSSLTAFAQTGPSIHPISPSLRLVFQASNLAKYRNNGEVCDKEAYESIILEKLETALKTEPALRSRVAGDPELKKALSQNLLYQEMIGNLKPGFVGIDAVLPKARFMSVALGAYGSHYKVQLAANGKTQNSTLTENPQTGDIEFKKSIGTWKITSRSKTGVKVKVNGIEYTLKKADVYGGQEYILEAKEDAGQEYKANSLFNNTQGECEA